MNKKDKIVIIGFVLFLLFVFSVGTFLSVLIFKHFEKNPTFQEPTFKFTKDFVLKKFDSDMEFEEYSFAVQKMMRVDSSTMISRQESMSRDANESPPVAISEEKVERYSGTNVQVQGIDELDIVKTDGKNIFFSQEFNFWSGPMPMIMDKPVGETTEPSVGKIPEQETDLKIIQAFPPEKMEVLSKIETNGEILLSEKILAVFENDGIVTYDVSEPKEPKESWSMEYGERFSLVDARLFNDEIFLIISKHQSECPVVPFSVGGVENRIACRDIYFSSASTDSDTLYSIYKIDVNSGKIKDRLSFLGSATNSIIYVSPENIFVTYYLDGDLFELQYNFVRENMDLFSQEVLDSLEKLRGYDISLDAKILEFEKIITNFTFKMSNDDLMKFENERENRLSDFYKKNAREINSTGILKVKNDSFEIESFGQVPGYLLNQFSLDEHNGFLRVATTVGERLWGWGMESNSLNDLYVLDSDLNIVGSALDMGVGERIYSVRFIEDKGYIVTFREIDPFYVLDLSNPRQPEIKGELKIPGYSSYLHLLKDNIVLGVGKEDDSVKLSLFDVSNVNKPEEVSKYILKEYWSDILNTHKAFLNDTKHQVFFVPGTNGAYIFSYRQDSIELVKTVSAYGVRRALFINDYFYIITDEKIIVLQQNNWEKINELKLR